MIKSDYCSFKSQYLQLEWFINVYTLLLMHFTYIQHHDIVMTKCLSFVIDHNSLILLTHILFKRIQIINKREKYNIISYAY